ncbi:HlyD family efflux transporter periplasmic adaptor subunit [Bacillus haikouensis]|uniref:HlyD family efflux transporter periplasmic adaptor subunit n=1 Tax=Bacillus haikouensis TaxID=1510468 RepID=UPI0015556C93|nr:HlyD family efflux transporter periplasmic adaptor subunit [Bacillus haikouensis]NQD65839.1 HlyD family efflux transporter periplasmic adaptor subunit [Bacillus haikouensis]
MQLYSKSDLKDSRVFFDKTPPNFLKVFIIFTLGIFIFTSYFATVVTKPYFVKAEGTVMSKDDQFISSQLNGQIATVNKQEGESVSEGEVLFTITTGQEGLQQSAIQTQIDELTDKNQVLDRFEESLNKQKNVMEDSGIEQEYYGKVQYYLLQVQTDQFERDSLNDQISKKETKKAELLSELEGLKKDLKTQENGEQIEFQAEETKGKIEAKEGEIEGITEEINQFEQQKKNPASQSKQVLSQLKSELGSARASIQSKLVELEAQQSVYSGQDSDLTIKSNKSGIVHYLVPVKLGMTVQANQVIAQVSNGEDELQVEAFIDSRNISMISEGDPVKLSVQGVNIQKYGTIEGKVASIDSGTLTQETSEGNLVFYKCVISLKKKELVARDGNAVEIIHSMPVEAKVIYKKETYYDWILKMLNFRTL